MSEATTKATVQGSKTEASKQMKEKEIKEKIELEMEKANKSYTKAIKDRDKGLATHSFGEMTAFVCVLDILKALLPTSDALITRWGEGYKKGKSDQKAEDNTVLERATTDAYVEGYDEGFGKGEAATIRTLKALGAANEMTMRLDEVSEAKMATRRLGCGIVFIKVTEDDDLKVIEFFPSETEYLTTPAIKPLSNILEETFKNRKDEVSE